MGEPAYRDIANAIRADIEARRLIEGDRLPTVRELAERFGVPTGTVSKAVDILRADGVIVARHGRGLYVRTFGRIVRSSPGRLSQAPTTAEAEALALPRGTPVIAVTRHAYTGARRCVEVNEMVLDSSAYTLEYVFGA